MRHKILDALVQKAEREPPVKGAIDSDETFFRVSYKGLRNLPDRRKAHQRGMNASKSGLFCQQVCVFVVWIALTVFF